MIEIPIWTFIVLIATNVFCLLLNFFAIRSLFKVSKMMAIEMFDDSEDL